MLNCGSGQFTTPPLLWQNPTSRVFAPDSVAPLIPEASFRSQERFDGSGRLSFPLKPTTRFTRRQYSQSVMAAVPNLSSLVSESMKAYGQIRGNPVGDAKFNEPEETAIPFVGGSSDPHRHTDPLHPHPLHWQPRPRQRVTERP